MIVADHELQELRGDLRKKVVVELLLPCVVLSCRETGDMSFVENRAAPQPLELLANPGRMNLDARGRLGRKGGS